MNKEREALIKISNKLGAGDCDEWSLNALKEIADDALNIEQALSDKGISEDVIRRTCDLLNAVGHIGVDFGEGEYQLCAEQIKEAQELYAIFSSPPQE